MGARLLTASDFEHTRAIRTLVVDGSPFWLQTLCNLIGTQDNVQTVGTAMGGWEALSQISVVRPDLILMNLQLPDLNGLETALQIRRKFSRVRVVLLTSGNRPDPNLLTACQYTGVNALVTKQRLREELFTEIQQIFARANRDDYSPICDP